VGKTLNKKDIQNQRLKPQRVSYLKNSIPSKSIRGSKQLIYSMLNPRAVFLSPLITSACSFPRTLS